MSSEQKFKITIDVADLILYSGLKVRIFWEGHNFFFKSPNIVVISTTLPSEKVELINTIVPWVIMGESTVSKLCFDGLISVQKKVPI